MNRGLFLTLMVLCACGRTEPVRGYRTPITPVTTSRSDGGTDGGTQLIEAGECVGTSRLCPRGFHCEEGVCVLNGERGELQVTLQWRNDPRTFVDLDLHLIEPFPVQGSCEIYFGSGGLFSCTAMGKLDLDANGACEDTDPTAGAGSDTENIIYPPDRAVPRGHYIVRVDYWSACEETRDVPFLVTVRNGPTITRTEGVFRQGEADMGQEGAGLTVIEFDVL